MQETGDWSLDWEDPLEKGKATYSTPVFLLGEFHGQKNLTGYSPWGHRVRHDWLSLNITFHRNETYNTWSFVTGFFYLARSLFHIPFMLKHPCIFIYKHCHIIRKCHIFVYSLIDVYVGCFYFLTIINNVVMDVSAHFSVDMISTDCG